MFVYLFGLSVGLFLPLAAYLLFRRSNRTTELPNAVVLRNLGEDGPARQLGRAVLPEETLTRSSNRKDTPRRLSFSSALKSGGVMQRPSLRNRSIVSSPRQHFAPSPLISPHEGTRFGSHLGGGLVDYVTKTRLKKDHELSRSPVMVRVKPASTPPPPVAQMVSESTPNDRETVLMALKQTTSRKRVIPSDTELLDDNINAAKRKRPPEGVGQGTKRQAADTASREGNKSVAKRSRNISGSVKGSVKGSDNQFSDKARKRQASPPTPPENKRPVVQQRREQQTKKTAAPVSNRVLLDDDIMMDDATAMPSKTSQKRTRRVRDQDQRDEKQSSVGTKSTGTGESTSRVESKEMKRRRRRSSNQEKPAVQVFKSNIPIYSPGQREGVALRRFVPLHNDPKAPLKLPAQLTKGKKYTKEDIEHDRQAAHSRVEYLLADDEENDGDAKMKESEDKTVSKDSSDAKDDRDATQNAEVTVNTTATEHEEPLKNSTITPSVENTTPVEGNASEVQTSAAPGLKLGGEEFNLPPPPSYESLTDTSHQILNEQAKSHSSITEGFLQQPSALIAKTQSSTELPKPSFSLESLQKGVASQENKPLFTFPSIALSTQSTTPLVSSSQLSTSTKATSILPTGFNLTSGISFPSVSTPQSEKTTTSAVSHDVVSPMSDEDTEGTPQQTGTTPNATVKTAPKVSFNVLPSSQTQTPQQPDATATTKFSFGLTPGQGRQKEKETSKTPNLLFNFTQTPQLPLQQQTQRITGGPSFSFGQNSSTPGGGLAPQSTPSNFSFSLKPQGKPTSGGGLPFQFESQTAGQNAQQVATPVPSFGPLGGNQTKQNVPATFNFSLSAATGQPTAQGTFGNQHTHMTPTFGAQPSGFLSNQSFTAGQGNGGQMGQTVGFTVGSSSSSQQRPVARARRRTQGKPR